MSPKRKLLSKYIAQIEQKMLDLYGASYQKILNLEEVRKAIESGDEEFSFKKHPAAAKQLEKQLELLANKASLLAMNGVRGAFSQGEVNANSTMVLLLGTTKSNRKAVQEICEQATNQYREQGMNARNYTNQKRGGFTISDRIWRSTRQARQEIEITIQNGIIEGQSAAEISQGIRSSLLEPRRLFRSVRDKETGQLRLSKAAREYHPGEGIYRSSYKNAMRVTRSEVNNAYRSAEWLSYSHNPLVKGYEIRLSNNHTTLIKGKPVPFHDICDELAGIYPVGFQWSGWHPQCRCAMIPIPLTPKEFAEYTKAKRDGRTPNIDYVSSLPKNYVDWVKGNVDRIKLASEKGNLPYFLQDNANFTEQILNPKTIEQRAAERHAARTKDEIADIQRRWNERRAKMEAQKHKATVESAQQRYGDRIYRMFEGVKDIDTKPLYAALRGGKSADIERAAKEVAKVGKEIYRLTKLKDPLEAARQYSLADARIVNEAVSKKLDSFKGLSADEMKKKLAFEIDWVEKHQKYATWKVARDAYQKELDRVEVLIKWKDVDSRIADLRAYKTSSGKFLGHLAEAERLRQNGATQKEVEAELAKAEEVRRINESSRISKEKAKASKKLAEAAAKKAKLESERDDLKEKVKEITHKMIGGDGTKGDVALRDKYKNRLNAIEKELTELSGGYVVKTLNDLKAELGKELPATLADLDKSIAKYEASSRYGGKAKAGAKEIEEVMREVFDTHDYGMNIDEDVLGKVLNSWFKNTFEVGGGNGYVGSTKTTGEIEYDHERMRAAHRMFMNDRKPQDQLTRGEYEKYGNLLDHNIEKSLTSNTATQYGQVEVRFKKEKVIATWTAGDSLGLRWQPTLTTDPKACSFDDARNVPLKGSQVKDLREFKRDYIARYLELQYHGKLTIDCVESVSFPYDLTQSRWSSIADKWKKAGFTVYHLVGGHLTVY